MGLVFCENVLQKEWLKQSDAKEVYMMR